MPVDAHHREVASRIVALLRSGKAPWLVPVKPDAARPLPLNPATARSYGGINALWLDLQGFTDPRWMTLRQANRLGGRVRRGEHGTRIEYWRPSNASQDPSASHLPAFRRYTAHVFNAEQMEGVPAYDFAPSADDPVKRVTRLVRDSGATFTHEAIPHGTYRPDQDVVVQPSRDRFASRRAYCAAALQGLVRWTGHPDRLGRFEQGGLGGPEQVVEELHTGIASHLLGRQLGIGDDPGARDVYVEPWARMIEGDPLVLFRAAADASRAVEFILGLERAAEQGATQQAAAANKGGDVDRGDAGKDRAVDTRTWLDGVLYADHKRLRELGASRERGKGGRWFITERHDRSRFRPWIADEREYLDVPPGEGEFAKSAKARWDAGRKLWFVGPFSDRERLERFQPGNTFTSSDPREEFAAVLLEMGFELAERHPLMDGQKHRLRTQGDKPSVKHKAGSGFYVGHLDGIRPAGYAKNMRTGEEVRWKHSAMPTRDRATYDALVASAQRKAEEADAKRAQEMRRVAKAVQRQCSEQAQLQAPTAYMERKQIGVHAGVYQQGDGVLMVPACDLDGRIWSCQYILPEGDKRFSSGGRRDGLFHVVGGFEALIEAKALVVAEGYATAATVSELLDTPVVCAFEAHNLGPVAQALHEKFPERPVLIAGDDDLHLERHPQVKRNVGREAAESAAAAVKGVAAFPLFAPKERAGESRLNDWNDLAVSSVLGREGAKAQLQAAMQEAGRKRVKRVSARASAERKGGGHER